MHYGTTIRKRCLHTFQQQPYKKTSSSWTHQSSYPKKTIISYYITAVAALSTFVRTTTTGTTALLYLQTKPRPHFLLYRPVLVRRIATAASNIGTATKTTRTSASSTTTITRNMSSSPTIMRDNGTITITPKKETDQSALIVITHGLGDSAEGFVDVAKVRGIF